ncbi:MAG: aldo/keto reductase [Fidelibacterota bacterium]|nr:MAG: aldo/keto reductase [Candidatus Neomarinimicrobiota bacterium]
METRKLGRTELELSVIGFGAWAIGGGEYIFGWGPQDDEDSIKAIHKALDMGVNWIDTAPVYGLGRSEEVVGRAIKGIRNEIIIATKCGRIWDTERNISASLKADSVRQEAEDSLRRLNTDVIDLYQIHWPDPVEDIEEGWSTVAKLVEEGKIRYPALSNFSVEQMELMGAIHPIASLQPPYSMLRRDIEADILPYCSEQGIGVVPYSPMQNGLLTGKFTKERIQDLPDDDFRKTRSPFFREPEVDVNLKLVEALRPIARRHERTLSQLALAWVLRRPEVTSAITGARKPKQIEETALAGDWELDDWTISQIEALLEKRDEELAGLKA